MNKKLLTIASLGLGAGLMYIFDPDIGKRRRAAVRDGVKDSVSKTTDAIKNGSQELKKKANWFASGVKHRLIKVDDEKLTAKVLDAIAAVVNNPASVHIKACKGYILLTGTLPEIELAPLLEAVASVREVRDVDNQIRTHRRATDPLPALVAAG